ncbi:F-box only protein 30-like [Asterias rubens]|uniref:F-box only protein 30-like n=1 Tax=Asterias rubens TaxID=7604 RepID=UPI001454F84A|nr:F-box only protein 30-like [Asterias rubens]XP_033633375.1 F-box only protein 30-like [Asterias rubens]
MDELQSAIHSHCDSCFKLWCNEQEKVGVSCLNISCSQDCGSRLHTCKLNDHLTRCPNTRIECLNKNKGCPATMLRKESAKHLIHCPAFVVMCGVEFRKDELLRHFQSDGEHDHKCSPILAEKMSRHKAAERLGEESEYDLNIPADNWTVSDEDRIRIQEEKKKKRDEAMRTFGTLLIKPTLSRPNNDLCKVPWEGKERLLSEVMETSTDPTSPLPAEGDQSAMLSPLSPQPDQLLWQPTLESLPFTVLKNIGRFLDAQGLTAMSMTSHFMRRVCASLLQERGMVTTGWERQVDDTWVEAQKIWYFAAASTND